MKISQFVSLLATVLPICTSVVALSDTTINTVSDFTKRSTVSTILADIENAATCTACEVQFPSPRMLARYQFANNIGTFNRIESPGGHRKCKFRPGYH